MDLHFQKQKQNSRGISEFQSDNFIIARRISYRRRYFFLNYFLYYFSIFYTISVISIVFLSIYKMKYFTLINLNVLINLNCASIINFKAFYIKEIS